MMPQKLALILEMIYLALDVMGINHSEELHIRRKGSPSVESAIKAYENLENIDGRVPKFARRQLAKILLGK